MRKASRKRGAKTKNLKQQLSQSLEVHASEADVVHSKNVGFIFSAGNSCPVNSQNHDAPCSLVKTTSTPIEDSLSALAQDEVQV